MKKVDPSIAHTAISNPRTLVELLRGRVLHQPERVAYGFLAEGQEERIVLTYRELDRRAGAIAARLQSLGLAGQRAVLLYPPGLEFMTAFWACICAGVVAVPAYFPPATARLQKSSRRVLAIIQDAEPEVGLTVSSSLAVAEKLFANQANGQTLRWLATDLLESATGERPQDPAVTEDSLAFLQYTSGSTATPKGVMVTHGNVLHNLHMLKTAFRQSEDSILLGWLPTYHDMGLIGGVLQPIYLGAPCTLMSPMHFLQQPFCWLQAMSRYRATLTGGPDFAYDLCVRKTTPEQRATLDLSSWTVALNGAEPVRSSTLDRFAAAFEPCGFRRDAFHPSYGLAEATLLVAGIREPGLAMARTFHGSALGRGEILEAPPENDDGRRLVSCGKIPPGQEVAIVDPETNQRRPPNRVGEVWVSGPNIAQGYWNRGEETEHTFRARLADAGERSFLRTGDLGFLHHGELFITGRLKDLIIVRGRNYYPQDIELTAEKSHASLRASGSAAFSVDVNNEERLVIVQEGNPRHQEVDAAIDSIRQDVGRDHEVQPYAIALIRSGTISKTSSGKIQRRACREAFLAGNLRTIAEWREPQAPSNGHRARTNDQLTREFVLAVPAHERQAWLQNQLRREFANILGVSESHVNIEQPLVNLGIDSVRSFELKNRIEKGLGVAVPVAKLLEGASVAHITTLLLDHLGESRAATLPAPAVVSEGVPDGLENAGYLLARIDALSDQEVEALLAKASTSKDARS